MTKKNCVMYYSRSNRYYRIIEVEVVLVVVIVVLVVEVEIVVELLIVYYSNYDELFKVMKLLSEF